MLDEKEALYGFNLDTILKDHPPWLVAVLGPLSHSSYGLHGRNRSGYQFKYTLDTRSKLNSAIMADIIRGGIEARYVSTIAHQVGDDVGRVTSSAGAVKDIALLLNSMHSRGRHQALLSAMLNVGPRTTDNAEVYDRVWGKDTPVTKFLWSDNFGVYIQPSQEQGLADRTGSPHIFRATVMPHAAVKYRVKSHPEEFQSATRLLVRDSKVEPVCDPYPQAIALDLDAMAQRKTQLVLSDFVCAFPYQRNALVEYELTRLSSELVSRHLLLAADRQEIVSSIGEVRASTATVAVRV